MNPILLDIPSELTTERLLLRTPRAGDGEIIFPVVRESLAELKPWMPWATDDYNQAGAEEWARRSASQFLSREQLQFRIFLRDGDMYLGNVGAFKFNWDVPCCEIGYWLRTSHTRQGYMTEAVMGLNQMLRDFLKMNRLEIRCDARNIASRRVAERSGYTLEGILRNDSLAVDGTVRDTCIFSRVPPRN